MISGQLEEIKQSVSYDSSADGHMTMEEEKQVREEMKQQVEYLKSAAIHSGKPPRISP